MGGKKEKPGRCDELKARAEKWMESEPQMEGMPPEETKNLIHELRVHQIELEMQNEELRSTQADLEESRAGYVDLYDFAPVGYLTLDEHGHVLEANLTAAKQLGIERSYLINKYFHFSVLQSDRDLFRAHLQAVFKARGRGACEVRLAKKGGASFHARLESIFIESSAGAGRCRTSVSDITLAPAKISRRIGKIKRAFEARSR